MTSLPGSPSALASPTNSPKVVRPGNGSNTSTRRRGAHCKGAASTRPISRNSGKRESWRCRPLPQNGGILRAFRQNPQTAPLPTPSGKIEITSETVASFGYSDCPGHPAWLPPSEGLQSPLAARFPLQLIANQPATRLHSQLDFGAVSLASKIRGREPVRIHPRDAAARGIRGGDVVRLFNGRGACLAAAVLSDELLPGVVQLSTGAWYDPANPAAEKPLCVHGNPNVLTRDAGTSRLAQGCTGQLTLVEIERWDGPLPPIKAFDPPPGTE